MYRDHRAMLGPQMSFASKKRLKRLPEEDGDLCAITCFFNSARYKRRYQNYRLFREHLTVPLVAVELSFDGNFELGQGDAEILLQFQSRDVLWQKERLLNLALKAVPKSFTKIAWIDCDVIFEHSEWASQASAALDQYPLVHLFRERHNLPHDARVEDIPVWDRAASAHSIVYRYQCGEITPEDFYLASAPLERRSTTGLGWASRRGVLDRHTLYDACILGGGDRAMLCAAFGEFEHAARAQKFTSTQYQHYLKWAEPFFQTVSREVGYVDSRLFHLWHGDLQHRRYGERYQRLAELSFDPFSDIALDENGCWRWNTTKPELQEYIQQYFASRNEDGLQ